MEYEKEPQSLSPWVLGGRVLFTLALVGCIWFIFSNSMAVADVSSVSSGRVLQLLQAVQAWALPVWECTKKYKITPEKRYNSSSGVIFMLLFA